MKKKYLKIFSIIIGILFLILVLGNFALNFWLQNKLPDYVKNNSDYLISYKTLEVHLGTGNIFATGISVNNKNPQNLEKLGLQGTVDTVSVSRFGIFDALFNKELSTSKLVLSNPNLNIILPNPNKNKQTKKENPFNLEELKITNGNISVFRATKTKFLSVSDLNLNVENLQMNEESLDQKLPLLFDHYDVNAKNLYFRPDNVYAFTAKYITTKEGQMSLKDFALNPLLSYQNFTRFYPKKRNLFDFKTSEMEFKDIILKDNKITLTKVRFENPVLKMFTTNVKPLEKEKSFKYDVNLEDLVMNNAQIAILKSNGSPLFGAENLTMNINKFLMNSETAKGNIPFQYDDFKINGKQIHYFSETQNVNVASLNIDPKSANLTNISVKPTAISPNKSSMDLTLQHLQLKIKEWKFIENKLSLNIDDVLVNSLNGKITSAKNPQKKKPTFEGIQFPLTIKNVVLKNSDLIISTKNQPLAFHHLNANIQNIELNANTVKNAIPFKTGFYSLTTKNFDYKTKFYNLSASLLKLNKNAVQMTNFAMKPTVSRAQFIRMIPTEKDQYDLKVNDIKINGSWDLLSESKFLNASNVTLNGMNADIFRSKIPKDDVTDKPLYSKLLRSIKFPMFIEDLAIKNSTLVYEEDTKKSDGPGKLIFNDFNLTAKNLNSGKMKGKPTKIPIAINCNFMNASNMKVNWNIDTASQNDAFTIAGSVVNIPASRLNPFIEPYLKIRATGQITSLLFDFKGNKSGLNGTLKMKHENLKVAILKQDGDKDKILSAVANLFVKSDSGKYPESVMVENVERDPTKSFFNLFWKGIEQGLKRTLIGKNAPETEAKVKSTIKDTKTTIKETKQEIKETKNNVAEKVENIKGKVQETKEKVKEKNVFKKIFKKKSDS